MPAFRLPLELELLILELATPPLLIDRIHHRVKFLRQIALVHRSLTKWAQVKLHEQFFITLRGRAGEQERLQERLKIGFGSPSSGTLSRLYLDTRAWHERGKWFLDRFDDRSDSQSDRPSDRSPAQRAVGRGDKALSGPWSPYAVLRPWLRAVKTVWLFTPNTLSGAGPFPLCTGAEHLEIDDSAWPADIWLELSLVAPASLTPLVLRSVDLQDSMPSLPNLRVLVLIRSYIRLDRPKVLAALPNLDVFESIASLPALHPDNLAFFRRFARTARFYQTTCPDPEEFSIVNDASLPTQPSRLEACTFTWLAASAVPSAARDPLSKLRAALVERTERAPLTVECIRSKATEEETIERVLAELVV